MQTLGKMTPRSELQQTYTSNNLTQEAFNFTNALLKGQRERQNRNEPISVYYQKQMMSFKGSSHSSSKDLKVMSTFGRQRSREARRSIERDSFENAGATYNSSLGSRDLGDTTQQIAES